MITDNDRRIAEEAAEKISNWMNAVYFGEVAPERGPADIILAAIAEAKKPLEEDVRRLREDRERFEWLTIRLEDVQVDNADPAQFDNESNHWPDSWREAIDAARAQEGKNRE